MKKLIFTLTLSFFTISAITSCKDTKKSKAETTEKEVASESLKFEDPNAMKAFQQYLQIEKALEQDNQEATTKYAKEMASKLHDHYPDMVIFSTKIAKASDIKEQRMIFSDLSEAMEKIAKKSISSGKLYKQFCPMAGADGSYWISTIKEVNNPYMGQSMLHCGKTESIIE